MRSLHAEVVRRHNFRVICCFPDVVNMLPMLMPLNFLLIGVRIACRCLGLALSPQSSARAFQVNARILRLRKHARAPSPNGCGKPLPSFNIKLPDDELWSVTQAKAAGCTETSWRCSIYECGSPHYQDFGYDEGADGSARTWRTQLCDKCRLLSNEQEKKIKAAREAKKEADEKVPCDTRCVVNLCGRVCVGAC